ncbi:MAG: hypothetical protein AB1773_13840 [Pseudomonadota bacterium]|jgi:hypothetical protein
MLVEIYGAPHDALRLVLQRREFDEVASQRGERFLLEPGHPFQILDGRFKITTSRCSSLLPRPIDVSTTLSCRAEAAGCSSAERPQLAGANPAPVALAGRSCSGGYPVPGWLAV